MERFADKERPVCRELQEEADQDRDEKDRTEQVQEKGLAGFWNQHGFLSTVKAGQIPFSKG
jgi:hypothetical protein